MDTGFDRLKADALTRLALPQTRRAFMRRAMLAAGGLAATGLLAACGGDDDEDEPDEPAATNTAPDSGGDATATGGTSPTQPSGTDATATAPAATEAATTPTAASNADEFDPPIVVLPVDPETLDPHFGESGPIGTVLGNVMEALVEYDRDMTMVPGLAESWEVLEDQSVWQFKLRTGVQFQNGAPFNADAVKFTIDRILSEELRAQGLSDPFPTRSGVQQATVIDDTTVEMTLAAPNIVLPVFVTFVYILEPGYYTETSIQDTALNPVGTGPWQVTEWVTGDHLTLEKFDGYWRGDPGIPEIIFKPIPERATRLNLLVTGEADIVGDLTPEDFPTIEGNDDLRISTAPGSRRMHLGIPTHIERYKDRAVRRALSQAIDVQGIAAALLGPMATEQRPTVLVSSTDWIDADIPLIEYDPDAAKAALEAAGFPMDEEIKIISPQGRYLKDTEVAQAVAGNLRDIGLNAEAEILDWTVYSDRLAGEQGLEDIYLLGLGSRFYGPEDVSIVTTGQIFDQTRWTENTENGPKFHDLYTTLTQTFDVEEQHRIVGEMLALFYEEAVWVPLWIQPVATAVNKRLSFEDSGGGNRFEFWLPGEDPMRVTG